MKDYDIKIKCPTCGREYLPAEIYIPNSFFGKPSFIDRNDAGKIMSYSGSSMDVKEKYICDSCSTAFKVTAKVSFYTSEITSESFDKPSSIKITPTNLFTLDE